MSLMGVVMLAGIALSNSILIVEFAHHLLKDGMSVRRAITTSCRVRLRPILMTSLATVIGLLPMALKLGEGSEAIRPLGASPHRRSSAFRSTHHISRSGGVLSGLPERLNRCSGARGLPSQRSPFPPRMI